MTDDNQSDRPTNQPTDGHEVSQESYTSKKLYNYLIQNAQDASRVKK